MNTWIQICEVKTKESFHQVSHATRSSASQNLVDLVINIQINMMEGEHLKHLTKNICGVGNAHILENHHTADMTIACH